jgi:hypothetical protein
MTAAEAAVQSGHWPLYRYRPGGGEATHPFQLDSADPSVPYADFARSEARFAMLARSDPARAAELLRLAQADVAGRWNYYQQLAGARTLRARARRRCHHRRTGGRVMTDCHHLPRAASCTARSWPHPARHGRPGDVGAARGLRGRCDRAAVLFEEQIEHEAFADRVRSSLGNDSHGEALSYLPQLDGIRGRPRPPPRAGRACPRALSIPVIASLNGVHARRLGALREAPRRRRCRTRSSSTCTTASPTRWCPRPTSSAGTWSWSRRCARPRSKVPLAVKLSPWFTALAQLREELAERRRRRPRAVQPALPARHRPRHARGPCRKLQLSTSAESRLPLHWIGQPARVRALLARRVELGRARRAPTP